MANRGSQRVVSLLNKKLETHDRMMRQQPFKKYYKPGNYALQTRIIGKNYPTPDSKKWQDLPRELQLHVLNLIRPQRPEDFDPKKATSRGRGSWNPHFAFLDGMKMHKSRMRALSGNEATDFNRLQVGMLPKSKRRTITLSKHPLLHFANRAGIREHFDSLFPKKKIAHVTKSMSDPAFLRAASYIPTRTKSLSLPKPGLHNNDNNNYDKQRMKRNAASLGERYAAWKRRQELTNAMQRLSLANISHKRKRSSMRSANISHKRMRSANKRRAI